MTFEYSILIILLRWCSESEIRVCFGPSPAGKITGSLKSWTCPRWSTPQAPNTSSAGLTSTPTSEVSTISPSRPSISQHQQDLQTVFLRQLCCITILYPRTPQPVQTPLLLPNPRRTDQRRCRTQPLIQERRFADQIDRDYELLNHNYHPYQLFTYELANKHIRKQNEAAEKEEKGEKTFDQAYLEEVQYLTSHLEIKSQNKKKD